MTTRFALTCAMIALLATTTAPARAGEEPIGCNGTATGIAIEALLNGTPTLNPQVPGNILFYRITLVNPLPTGCNFFGGQLSITHPDGTSVPLAGFGAMTPAFPAVPTIGFLTPFTVTSSVPYIVDEADAVNGIFTARADYGGTVFQPLQMNGTFITVPEQATASATTSIPHPLADIAVVKSGSPTIFCDGEPTDVTYTYTVTTGDGGARLFVAIEDDQCGPVLAVEGVPGFNVGDTNANGILNPGEVWQYTCTTTLTEATLNTVTVTGTSIVNPLIVVQDTDTFFVDTYDVPIVTVDLPSAEICAGQMNDFCALITGGTPPFTTIWTGPGEFTSNETCIFVGVAGEYCVTVTDSNGCVDTACGTLIVNPNPVVAVDDDAVCAGFAGTLTADTSDGTPPYSWVWIGPGGFVANTQTINPTVAGVYSVVVTDANGCNDADDGTLTVHPNPTVSVTGDAVCSGFAGTLTANPSGGTPPYAFAWSGPGGFAANTPVINPTVAGLYSVTVTDSNSCVDDASGTLTLFENPVVTVTGDEVCAGFAGTITTLVVGGTPPFSYVWVGPGNFSANTATIMPTQAGEYCVTVTDSNGCIDDNCAELTVYSNPIVSVNDDAVCAGFAGTLTAATSGGDPPYSWSWTGPGGFAANTQVINPTVAGVYSVTVTDANGCVDDAGGTLTLYPNPTVAVNDDAVCDGFAGTLTAATNGGTPPYSWSWTGPGGFAANTQVINPTVAGAYSVTVTDANGCVDDAGGTLTLYPNPTVAVNDDAVCDGFAGTLTAATNGGTPPYAWSWTGPGGFAANTQVINPTVAGAYSVTVTDANGCVDDASGTLTLYPNPTVSVNDDAVCAGFAGSLTASPSGGTRPYTYAWTGPGGFAANTQAINPTVAGVYSVTVTDANGCVDDASGTLTLYPNPTVAVNDDAVCAGFAGTLTAATNGGTPPYAWSWTGPGGFAANTQVINPTVAGVYSVTVTDANGCVDDAGGTLTLYPNPTVAVNDDAVCAGFAGTLTAATNGGTPPYAWSWTGPGGFAANTQVINPTVAGAYSVTVTDANGCVDDASGTLTLYPNPTVSVNDDAVCDGFAGTLTAATNGGTPPYAWSWTGPGGFAANTQVINPTVAGVYSVTVTDANGCVDDAGGTLTLYPNPTVAVNDDAVCAGFAGTLTAATNGGTPPYAWSWTGPGGFAANTQVINPTVAGAYSVTVTDANGCVDDASGTLTLYPNPTVSVNDDAVCDGFAGTLTAATNGGTPPYAWSWTGPGGFAANTQVINPTVAGVYSVTVTDANGCVDDAGGTLTLYPNPTVAVNDDAVCAGFAGTLTAATNGGTPPYAWSWTGPGGFAANTQVINPTVAGVYSVTVTDANGCVDDAGGTLTLYPNPTVAVNDDAVCAGFAGTLTAATNGGTPPYAWSWTGPGGFAANTQVINPTVAGAYSVTVTDANGCVDDASGTLTLYPNPTVSVGDDTVCSGDSGTITATPSGGTPPYSYAWSGPGGFASSDASIVVSAPGDYCVVVTDGNGCIGDACAMFALFETPTVAVNDDAVCNGFAGTLTAATNDGTPPYAWSWTGPGGFAANTQAINPTIGGLYEVIVTDANGCQASSSGTLTIYENPAVTVADDTVCDGFAGTLTASTNGGTPPYAWSWTGPGGFAANTQAINPTVAGVYSVTVTDANGCVDDASGTFTLDPNPMVAVNDAEICAGDSTVLCATPSGGVGPFTYAWSNGETTECITVSDAGTYSVTVTDANGCTAMDSGTLTVNPNPIVTVDDASVCAGDSADLCANASGGTPPYSYEWSSGETTECITVSDAGTYSVTVTDANGCIGQASADLDVNPNPMVAVDPPSQSDCIDNNDGGEFCAAAVGGTPPYTYAWSTGATTECITVFDEGIYTVTVTDANGCSASAEASFTLFPGDGVIGDFVWSDDNGDGTQDGGESGIPNVTVTLIDGCNAGGAVIAVTSTGSMGEYFFEDLCSGDYLVVFSDIPAGFFETIPNQGDDETDSDCIEGVICVTLPGDATVDLSNDCGLIPEMCDVVCEAIVLDIPEPEPDIECRVTGGGNNNGTANPNRFTFGGQAGAPTASQPQPCGEWTHTQHSGPDGKWTFHAGTASAPDFTEIDFIVCSDPGPCTPSGNPPSPAKQIDFEGVGTFKNIHQSAPSQYDFIVTDETLHWFSVHIEDAGEPGNQGDPAGCPIEGHAGGLVDCDCPDFYHFVVHTGPTPDSPVLYEEFNYISGGNLQIHQPTNGGGNCGAGNGNSPLVANPGSARDDVNGFGADVVPMGFGTAYGSLPEDDDSGGTLRGLLELHFGPADGALCEEVIGYVEIGCDIIEIVDGQIVDLTCGIPEEPPIECRVTGGGNNNNTSNPNRFTFGGQAGAPTASQPQPCGEWTHTQHSGPDGKWTFHAGTASAPDFTEIDFIVCSDPGPCTPSGNPPSPAKQIDFEGVGTFKNIHQSAPAQYDFIVTDETLHWFSVHIEDAGEPGNQGDPAGCPIEGHAGGLVDCDCPDFYHFVVHTGPTPDSPVLYEEFNYISGGNLQIHQPTNGGGNCGAGNGNSPLVANPGSARDDVNGFGADVVPMGFGTAYGTAPDAPCEWSFVDGVLVIQASEAFLHVIGTSPSGATAECSIDLCALLAGEGDGTDGSADDEPTGGDPEPITCVEDIDGDDMVDATDLVAVLGAWGPQPAGHPCDFDGDLEVGATDLVRIVTNWGACGTN